MKRVKGEEGEEGGKCIDESGTEDSAAPKKVPKVEETEGDADCPMKLVYHLNSVVEGAGEFYNAGTVAITDVVTPDAEECLLTTYEIDTDWLFASLPFLGKGDIPATLVHGASVAVAVPPRYSAKNVSISCPRMPIPYGVNHGKLFLVYLKSGALRFCVTTANLIEMDWTRKTQGVWMQEFPRKDPECVESCDFEDTLVDYIERVAGRRHCARIREFDFTTANAVLVTSVPGYHNGRALNSYGHMKIRKTLGSLYKPLSEECLSDSPIYCQFSSLGSLTEKWLEEFYTSFSAHAPVPSNGAVSVLKKRQEPLSRRIKFIWPTRDFVMQSIDGVKSGNSLCCPLRNMKDWLLREPYLCRYNPPAGSGRQKIPPHIKTYTRVKDGDDMLPWVCLTSANMSQAAWGTLQKKDTQLMIRHFEIGVLFVPPQDSPFIAVGQAPPEARPGSCAGADALLAPLPYGIPLEKYGPSDKPWAWGNI